MNVNEVIMKTEDTLRRVENMEDVVLQQAESQSIAPMAMMYSDGTPAMMPILTAKAQLLGILYAEVVYNRVDIQTTVKEKP